MLCEITIPYNFDYASKMVALTGAIKTVCTAAANSTPSYEARQTYNDTSGTTTEIITRVVDNTVAGGWTLQSQNIQNLPGQNWSSQSAAHPSIQLRQASGATDANIPFLFLSISGFTNNSGSRVSNQNPFVRWGYGTAATMQDSNTSGNYSVYRWVTSNNNVKDSSYVAALTTNTTDDNPGYNVFGLDQTSYNVRYFISSGDGYFTIIAPGYNYQTGAWYGAAYGGSYFHLGKRTAHNWETSSATNHTPWTAVWNTVRYNNLDQNQHGGVWSRMQLLNWTTGDVTGATMYDHSSADMGANNINPVNGCFSNSTTVDYYNLQAYSQFSGVTGGTPSSGGYFPGTTALQAMNTSTNTSGTSYTIYRNQTYHHRWPIVNNSLAGAYERGTSVHNFADSWTYDADTSTVVPGIYPMKVEAATSNGNLINHGNHLKHMFFAGVASVSAISNYLTDYALFTINGEKYLPVGIGGTATNNYHEYYWIKV